MYPGTGIQNIFLLLDTESQRESRVDAKLIRDHVIITRAKFSRVISAKPTFYLLE
jgi:hypothetical protein